MVDTQASTLNDQPARKTTQSPESNRTGADVRLERILDYVNQSLAKLNPLEASLGALNADLMLMAYRLRQVLDDALQEGAAAFEELEELAPTIDQLLRILKQIERFSQLAIKLGNGNTNSNARKMAAILLPSEAPLSEDSGNW